MKFTITNILFLFIYTLTFSQELVCSSQDKEAFENKIIAIDGYLEKEFGKTITSIGKTFLGTPYVDKTLEIDEKEPLVINLKGFDCTTYVENVLAFSLLVKNEKTNFRQLSNIAQSFTKIKSYYK